MKHAPAFLNIVDDAKSRVKETSVDEVKQRLDRGETFKLVDVREESEWAKGHLPNAVHLSKGVIERDIENAIPDKNTEVILYCGGGFRSADFSGTAGCSPTYASAPKIWKKSMEAIMNFKNLSRAKNHSGF